MVAQVGSCHVPVARVPKLVSDTLGHIVALRAWEHSTSLRHLLLTQEVRDPATNHLLLDRLGFNDKFWLDLYKFWSDRLGFDDKLWLDLYKFLFAQKVRDPASNYLLIGRLDHHQHILATTAGAAHAGSIEICIVIAPAAQEVC